MTIEANDAILKFGAQDVIDDTSGTIADDAFSVAGDVDSAWTNAEEAPLGSAVLTLQFDTTMPTVGSVGLYARLLDIDGGTGDAPIPSSNYPQIFLGSFPIDFGVAADTDFITAIEAFKMPSVVAAQPVEFYIKNEGTGQTIGTGWGLLVGPYTEGPSA